MFKSVDEFQKFSTEQMDAASRSATALSEGVQQIFTETTALSRTSVEAGTAAFQSLLASRSFDRVMQVQMDFAKSAYESMMAGSTRIGGIMSATAQDMAKPLEGAFARMQGTVRG